MQQGSNLETCVDGSSMRTKNFLTAIEALRVRLVRCLVFGAEQKDPFAAHSIAMPLI